MMDASLGDITQGNFYNILSNPSFIIIVVLVVGAFVLIFSMFDSGSDTVGGWKSTIMLAHSDIVPANMSRPYDHRRNSCLFTYGFVAL